MPSISKPRVKRKKIITRYVHDPVFNTDIVLVISDWCDFLEGAHEFLPLDKLQALTKMVEKHGEDPHCLATQFPFPGGGSIIWLHHESQLSTLVHEIVHAAHHLLEKRDTPLSSDTEETYAYLIEFLFKSLTKQDDKKK